VRRAAGKRILAAAAFALLASGGVRAGENAATAGGAVEKDTTWKGRVLVERSVTVAKGVVLTVSPGAVVTFAKGAGLTAEGSLVATGTKDAPVRFASALENPSPGDWEGIRFAESAAGSVLSGCVVRDAAAVDIFGPEVEVRDCDIGKGKVGLIIRQKTNPKVVGNVVADMTEGGIQVTPGSYPAIEGNTLRACGPYGIECPQNSAPVIRGNEISGCERGLSVSGAIPPVEGNVFRKNVAGLVVTSSGSGASIRGNRFDGNETGLFCEQFSDPLVEGNTFTGNNVALLCFRSSSPLVRNNEIAGNDQGIVCTQLCHPKIVGNEIRGNRKGIYLTLSSYATANGNNIHGNEVQMELGNMSSDWERRVRQKPVRGSAAQMATQLGRGVASAREMRQLSGDNAVIAGSVDATGNWWGEKDTGEMEAKGPDANIGGLVDYFDVPVRTYDEDPVEYVQDRIVYEGWKKTRIPGAGLPGKGKGTAG